MHHIITVQQHNKEQTFQLTQVESHYFLLIIALKVIAQISKPTHFHTLRQMQAPSFMCLLRYWPLSDVCEVSGLNIFTLWPAACRGLLGQHRTAPPYQQTGNTCRTASV